MKLPRIVFTVMALALALSNTTGCAVVMATKQPSKKNMAVLTPGTPRALVVAEFGAPITSETKDGKRLEVFSFEQGYSKGAKVSRAFGHGVADVFTLGLWEVVGTPTEAIFDGQTMVVQVSYDSFDKVENVVTLKQKG